MLLHFLPEQFGSAAIAAQDDFVPAHFFVVLQILIHDFFLAATAAAPYLPKIAGKFMFLQILPQTLGRAHSPEVVRKRTEHPGVGTLLCAVCAHLAPQQTGPALLRTGHQCVGALTGDMLLQFHLRQHPAALQQTLHRPVGALFS